MKPRQYRPHSTRADTIFLLSFVSQIVIEIKFFSASPRLRASAVQLISPCFLRGSVPPWWVLVFGCGSSTLWSRVLGFGIWLVWVWICYGVVVVKWREILLTHLVIPCINTFQ